MILVRKFHKSSLPVLEETEVFTVHHSHVPPLTRIWGVSVPFVSAILLIMKFKLFKIYVSTIKSIH